MKQATISSNRKIVFFLLFGGVIGLFVAQAEASIFLGVLSAFSLGVGAERLYRYVKERDK